MLNVEQAIREVGAVYQALTGRAIEAGRSDLPPEVDPLAHIEGQYRHFKALVEPPVKGAGPLPSAVAWAPPVDVIELAHEVRCEIDVPGVSRDEVSVSVAGDHLIVRGRRASTLPASACVRHAERPAGPFQRVIALPPRARRDGIEAALRDGVLCITIMIDGASSDTTKATIDVK